MTGGCSNTQHDPARSESQAEKKQPGLGDQTEKVLESRCAVKLGALQTSYPAARKRPLTVLHIPEHAADDVGVDRDACTVS